MTENRYLENTHLVKSTINAEHSILWYSNSNHLTITVANKNRTRSGGKYAEFHASAEDARAIIDILQNYIDTSEATP